jgi:hypothetical protein
MAAIHLRSSCAIVVTYTGGVAAIAALISHMFELI